MSFAENSLSLQNITTLLNDETNKLKNVFIVFYKNYGDSSVRTDYNWKAGKSLQINKLIQYKKVKTKKKNFILTGTKTSNHNVIQCRPNLFHILLLLFRTNRVFISITMPAALLFMWARQRIYASVLAVILQKTIIAIKHRNWLNVLTKLSSPLLIPSRMLCY